MKHGVVVGPNFEISGSSFNLDCMLDAKEVRRYLLYWDSMVYAFPNKLGEPNLGAMPDLTYLHDLGILSLKNIPVTTG